MQQVQAGIHHLIEVVRGNVGSHAHGNAAGTVDKQIGQPRGQHRRLHFLAVIVGRHIDSLLVDFAQDFARNALQPAFRVPVGSCRIAIHRTEVALPANQRIAHGKILRHAHQRLISGRVAVRVETSQHIAHHARAFHIRPVPDVVGFVHGIQHTPVHRLETVARIRQGAAYDHAHGVIQIAAPHFLFQANRQGFLGKFSHIYMEAATSLRRDGKRDQF